MNQQLPVSTAEPPNEAAGEVSLSEFVYGRVLDMLLSGTLRAGAVLQERRLAEMLEVSRTPVREALGRLEAEALVSRRQGRTLVVADVGIETYVNLLDMRRILEVEAAGRATGRISAARVEEVVAANLAMAASAEVSPAQHWATDELVHATIAEQAGNPMVAATIRDLRRRTHIFDTARIAHRRGPGAQEHIDLIRAVAGSDPARSRELMGRHLDNVRDAIIDFILGRKG
jgi:DNA-binding GntR family transcriptional regulator